MKFGKFGKCLTAIGLAAAIVLPAKNYNLDPARTHPPQIERAVPDVCKAMLVSFPFGFFQNAGLIKSIQTFSITIGSGASSNTATINSVNTATACIVWGGSQCSNTGSSDATNDWGYLVLTNATTITATRAATGAITLTIKGTVIEWQTSAVKSVQSGTIVIGSGSTSNTATITSVVTNNSICLFEGFTTSTNGSTGQAMARVSLTSATVVTASRNTATANTVTVGYFVVEFQSGILNSNVQTGNITGVSGTPQTATISSVTTTNTWLIYNGLTVTNTGNSYNEIGWITLTNSTTVTYTSGPASVVYFTVCEFKTANIKSNSYASVTTTTASGTATFTAVNTSLAWVTFLGTICNTSTSSVALFDVILTNTTTATAERNTGPTSATTGLVMMELMG